MKHLLIFLLVLGLVIAKPHPQAVQSANEIIQGYSGHSSTHHISDDLRNIARYGHSLPEDVKRELKNLGFNFNGPIVNRTLDTRDEAEGLDETYENGMFLIHYTTTGTNAVSILDTNNNSIPDYIEQISDVIDYVVAVELTTLGFVEPPGDGWYPLNNDNGGSGLYDIYIRNLSANWYGYVQPEYYANNNGNNEHSSGVTEVNAVTSYMAMRNNYNGFPNTLRENIKVTIAHEYFHAVQFGYDSWEESWVLEATAVQMEEMVYDDINDCYQYMPSWFRSPHQSLNLDSSNRWYGSYIFFEYVNTHLVPDAIRTFFEKSITHESCDGCEYSIQTLDEAFQDFGSSFAEMLNGMSIANRILSSNISADPFAYEEADAYSVTPWTLTTVSYTVGINDTVTSTNLQANAAQYIRLISNDPVLATLTNDVGADTDLELHVIMTYGDSAWTVWSDNTINVDPAGATRVYFVVVSQNPDASDFDYSLSFTDGQTSIEPEMPDKFSISNAYPNPFNPQTHIQIDLSKAEYVKIYVYDIRGRIVRTLIDNRLNSGRQVITWNGLDSGGSPAASGTYFVRVRGENQENWQKVTLLK